MDVLAATFYSAFLPQDLYFVQGDTDSALATITVDRAAQFSSTEYECEYIHAVLAPLHHCVRVSVDALLSGVDLLSVEADTYWCLSKLLDSVHDNFTTDLPGKSVLRAHATPLNLYMWQASTGI